MAIGQILTVGSLALGNRDARPATRTEEVTRRVCRLRRQSSIEAGDVSYRAV